MICLGIESTAHTFSVGIVTDAGKILSVKSDTYNPNQGGLHPSKVVEHHYNCFEHILQSAMQEAQITFQDLGLVAFSQGPGLGPCLRVGAAVARSLAQKLKLPIMGVNHCIAHVEIGRLECNVDDPVTLYVSGGNTIISAFESGRYQIFGETLDLPIGNMLDMVAREIGIPHPGGPKIEKIAQTGSKYIVLPYIVKGMDLSFSGLFTSVAKKLKKLSKSSLDYSTQKADLIYSLQETSFAMLSEVCERAIAHTEKSKVLLTGGVAANSRLQEMIRYVSEEHGAEFHVVPRKVAGDNGAMIAWTGILQYREGMRQTINETKINPKWRMDQIKIPWRMNKIDLKHENEGTLGSTYEFQPSLIWSNDQILEFLQIDGKIIRKGAEAALIRTKWYERDALIKFRLPKAYRNQYIDHLLREKRTLSEVRTLLDLLGNGIPVPQIYDIDLSNGIFIMKYIEGERLKDLISLLPEKELVSIFFKIGQILAKIHECQKIHGDLTTSNIIYTPSKELFFIDFGLTEDANGIEERAMDLHLMKRVLVSTHGNFFTLLYPPFLQGYQSTNPPNSQEIVDRIESIELRGRYIEKQKRRKKN